MEPNWNQTRGPWQDSGAMQTPVQGGVRRPVEDGTRAQRPLGQSGAHRDMPYRVQQPPQGGMPRQDSGAWQEPFQQPGQPWAPQHQPWQNAPPDPFEETGVAPELAQQRSENIYDRESTFWHSMEDLNRPGAAVPQQHAARPDRHALRWIVIVVAVLVGVGFLVYGTVFRVRELSVQGNRSIPAEEVIRLAGVKIGMNTLALDEAAVEKGIESNRYLSFVCVDVKLPDKLVIQVRERTPAALIKYCGILYTVDNRGMVLEESFDTDYAYPGLVAVEGLDIQQCEVGKPLVLGKARQMDVYTTALIELKVMGAMDQIKELDLTDMDNLFIVSTDRYSVRLGSSDNLHAKLRSMLMVLDKLREEGYGVGTVDVSTPVNPTYIPEKS